MDQDKLPQHSPSQQSFIRPAAEELELNPAQVELWWAMAVGLTDAMSALARNGHAGPT